MEITKENIKELVGLRLVPNVKQGWEALILGTNDNYCLVNYSDSRVEQSISTITLLRNLNEGDWILLPQEKTTQPHYDNTNGSLYLFAQQHKLNAWEFDILKRVVRCRKKGEFETDLKKTIEVINLYLKEYEPNTTTTN
jgi:hypothetical protein